jgi:probable phosphoglycerate mutase
MAAAPVLVFIRHGETDWNVEARLQGQQDIPLNDRGRLQARRNGEALLSAIPAIVGFEFVASPLMRARETMEILRGAMNLDPGAYRVEPELLEITFGAWEGFTLAELAARGGDDVARRAADKWGFVPPGGESYAMLATRIDRWLHGLTRDTVAVSHGAVGRVVEGRLRQVDPREVPMLEAPQDRVLVYRAGQAAWL